MRVLLRLLRAPVALLLFTAAFTTTTAWAAPAPDVPLTTAAGPLLLKDLHGEVIYLDFWASWCGPCRKSFPWMNEMQARYGNKGLRIVAINVDSDPALAKKFLDQNTANFTIAYDTDGKAAEQFGLKGMPSSYLIDRTGNVQSTHIGFKEKDAQAMEASIRALITQ